MECFRKIIRGNFSCVFLGRNKIAKKRLLILVSIKKKKGRGQEIDAWEEKPLSVTFTIKDYSFIQALNALSNWHLKNHEDVKDVKFFSDFTLYMIFYK